MSGFASAEGYFGVRIRKSYATKVGFVVELRFELGQHFRDADLIRSFITYFGSGSVYEESNKNFIKYHVYNFDHLYYIIIPFFRRYPIRGIKYKDFMDFCKISEIIKNKNHLNNVGINEIIEIRNSMNNKRIQFEEDDLPSRRDKLDILFMYNRDRSILFYYTNNVKEFSEYLKIYKFTLLRHLTNGTYYLNKYFFSAEFCLSSTLIFKNLSLPELNLMLTKDREKFIRKIKD